jgi:hypothetical protein
MGVLNLVQIKEVYLEKLLIVLAVECCGAVIGLFRKTDFFEDQKPILCSETIEPSATIEPQQEICKTTVQEKTDPLTQKIGPASAREYFDTLNKFANRFAEQSEFTACINGSVVKWNGVVNSASGQSDGGAFISLTLDNLYPSEHFFLNVPPTCSARALSLHKGDVISFTAILDTSIPVAPHLKAETFQLEVDTLNSSKNNSIAKEEIIYEAPSYFKMDGGIKDGPYCQHCYDNADKKLIRLQQGGEGIWDCLACGHTVFDKNYQEPAPRGIPRRY